MTNLAKRSGWTSAPSWKSKPELDLSELAQARVETINLVQWLARVANSYVSDGSSERTTLRFRAGDAAFVTQPFDNNLALEIRLPTLEMQFLDHGKPVPHVFDPEERSPAEAEAWILVELLHRCIDRDSFSTRLPYTIPGLMSGDAEDYSPQSCQPGLTQLATLFQDAAAILDAVARAESSVEATIVCLPETLDLRSDSRTGRHRLGFSPGDAQNPEPYFHVSTGAARGARRPVATARALIAEDDPVAAAAKLRRLAAD
jgi:hypothetical protein